MVKSLATSPAITFIPVRDGQRAKTFYRDTLGLQLVSEELPFALVFDLHGTMLRVTIVQEPAPQKHTVLGWDVDNIAATVEELRSAGVRLERYGLPGQDTQGIWTAPSGVKIAWFKDPEGNLLSLTQF